MIYDKLDGSMPLSDSSVNIADEQIKVYKDIHAYMTSQLLRTS